MNTTRLRKFTAVALVSLLLAACASAPQQPAIPGEVAVLYTTQYAHDRTLKEYPKEVTIVRRSDTGNAVAGQVVLNIAMLALGGGFGFQGFSKEQLKGSPIETGGPRTNLENLGAGAILLQLESRVKEFIQQHPELQAKTFEKPVLVAGNTRLIYDTLMEDEAERFRLVTDMEVYKRPENPGFLNLKAPAYVNCKNQSDSPLPLEEWAKDDFLPVKETLERMVSECESKFVAELPNFFKD